MIDFKDKEEYTSAFMGYARYLAEKMLVDNDPPEEKEKVEENESKRTNKKTSNI